MYICICFCMCLLCSLIRLEFDIAYEFLTMLPFMTGYTKLFGSLIGSTIWREPDHVRIVWITMLAIKDRHHVVEASVPGLADFARVTLPKCEEALEVLKSPDKHSRTKEFDGRRIEEVPGGWRILNGEKYRAKMNADERREANKIYQRRWREKNKAMKVSTSAEERQKVKDFESGKIDQFGEPKEGLA